MGYSDQIDNDNAAIFCHICLSKEPKPILRMPLAASAGTAGMQPTSPCTRRRLTNHIFEMHIIITSETQLAHPEPTAHTDLPVRRIACTQRKIANPAVNDTLPTPCRGGRRRQAPCGENAWRAVPRHDSPNAIHVPDLQWVALSASGHSSVLAG
jgi:hypothetical protein